MKKLRFQTSRCVNYYISSDWRFWLITRIYVMINIDNVIKTSNRSMMFKNRYNKRKIFPLCLPISVMILYYYAGRTHRCISSIHRHQNTKWHTVHCLLYRGFD